jgi:exodeoxyribonuclease V gamma subunit
LFLQENDLDIPKDHCEADLIIVPGLSIIHANHLEDLRQVAVAWIRRRPLKPLENELFLIQSNGMAQWLKLGLADDDGCGIAAAMQMQMPARFLWSAYRVVLGPEAIPRESPFEKDRLIWRLLEMLPDLMKKDCFQPLARYLDNDRNLRKRYQLACRLADIFDQYQVYRADWLEDWENGVDRLRNALGAPTEMPDSQMWQAELWRSIDQRMSPNLRGKSRSSLHRRFLKAVQNLDKRPAGLPRRVIVFGICSLPQQTLDVLHAVSRLSQVMVCIHNPCRYHWADIIEDRELLRIESARQPRKPHMPEYPSPELLHQQVNPLLAAWGKQGRDYMGLLASYDRPETYRENFAEIDLFRDVAPQGSAAGLLKQVQQAVLDLRSLPSTLQDRPCIDIDDGSIQFHLAHSPQREVEILHDQLLACFAEIPGLHPRDVIVMTPDIDAYAPHIEAVFGNIRQQDQRYIPFTVADSPERAGVPMREALDKLLHLPESRMAVSDVIDLLDVPAFRNRFDLAETDLPKLRQWIEDAGIRWGLNAEHRTGFELPAGLEQNTWLFGLRRMLLGYASGAGRPWRGIEPYDEVGGLEAALVGPLATLLETLERYCHVLNQPTDAQTWFTRIRDLSNDCFQPTDSAEQLVQSRMESELEKWLNACIDAGLTESLPLTVVREAFLSAIQESSLSQRFLAGKVNFCTLMPMRAIPFKVVCLLGMNDGKYPRSRPPLDFDLMAAKGAYRPGDRSRREDDRYLFLEALLSAREKLYISYIGRNIQDNSEQMPSVLVGQLRDYLAAGWRLNDTSAGSDTTDQDQCAAFLNHLTCQHPLQPFSRAYFLPDRNPTLLTYAHEWRDILNLQPGTALEVPPPVLSAYPIDAAIQMNDLIRFLKHPVHYFFNRRLKVYFDDIQATAEDHEPFALDRLAPFSLGARLLSAGLAAGPEKSCDAVHEESARLRRTGVLPLKGFGELAAADLIERVLRMLDHHHKLIRLWPVAAAAREILLKGASLSSDVFLEDWMDGLRQADSGGTETYARWEFYGGNILGDNGKILRLTSAIGSWVKHLVGCAQGISVTSYLAAPDAVVQMPPLDQVCAEKWLDEVVMCWKSGLTHPLPVTAKTALAFLSVMNSDDSKIDSGAKLNKAMAAARKVYEGDGYNSLGELGYSRYLMRSYPDFNTIWQASGHPFHQLAQSLYSPLLQTVRIINFTE